MKTVTEPSSAATGERNITPAIPLANLLQASLVFKLAPSHGSWIESDLHVFQASDGIYPNGDIALDSAGRAWRLMQDENAHPRGIPTNPVQGGGGLKPPEPDGVQPTLTGVKRIEAA